MMRTRVSTRVRLGAEGGSGRGERGDAGRRVDVERGEDPSLSVGGRGGLLDLAGGAGQGDQV